MAKKKGLTAEEVGEYKAWLQAAKLKFVKTKEIIERGLDYYRGKQNITANYQDAYMENQVFNSVNTIASSIIDREPKIKITARKKPYVDKNDKDEDVLIDTVEAAKAKQVQLNYWIRYLRIKRQLRKALMDALVGVWGIIYLGYTVKTDKVNSDDETTEPEEHIKSESPFAVRLSPFDFLKDPDSKDHELSDSSKIAIKWVKLLKDIKENKDYVNTQNLESNFTIDVREDSTKESPANGEDYLESSDILQRVVGWDIWDKRTQKIITIVEEHDKEIRIRDWPWDLNGGFPVETLFFNENPDGAFPISSVDQYIDTQDILNELNAALMAHVRKVSQRKYLSKKGGIDEAERFKLERGADGTIVEVNGSVDETIKVMQDAQMSQDFHMALSKARETISMMSGVPAYEQGGAKNFDTAAEPKLLQQGMSVKRADKRNTVEDFVVRVISKLDRIIQETIEEEEIPLNEAEFEIAKKIAPTQLMTAEKIVGSEKFTRLLPWLRLTKWEIKGDYEYTIENGSMAPVSEASLKQDTITLVQLLQNNPYISQYKATKRILENFGVHDHGFLKDEAETDKAMAQRAQAAQQAAVMEIQAKTQTDLQKTQIKSETAKEVALINTSSNENVQNNRGQIDIGKELIKDSGKQAKKGES